MRPRGAGAEEPFVVVNPGAGSPFLLVGDHAGREIPAEFGNLGLGEADLARHIAWDIGIAMLGDSLARRLSAPFIRQRYSRLVIDCNRDPAREDAIPEISDGTPIPGNAGLTDEQRAARRRMIFDPYHARIDAELDGRARRGQPTILIALHSFTPALAGQPTRPWRFGVLHMNNSPYSRRVLRRLIAEEGADFIGDNEPYAMDVIDYTAPHHACRRGIDYLELETRQDLLVEQAHAEIIAERLAPVLLESVPA
jgi:predicted N-formylglutamate amidohydrolase